MTMLIRDVMTTNPACCRPTDTLDTVAKLMLEHDCGEIPVCENDRLVGVITDRDITLRAVAAGKAPMSLAASEVMTRDVYSVYDSDKLETAFAIMSEKLVRRLPVIDANGAIIGILSQADLVAKVPSFRTARLMKSVAKKTRKAAMA